MTSPVGTETYRTRLNRAASWRLDCALPDGHRIFQSQDTSLGVRWAIADDSGATPPETDDGVLLLDIDPQRPLLVSYVMVFPNGRPERETTHCSIPLLTLDGALSRTPTDAATLLLLAAKFNWPIRVKCAGIEHTYEVREIKP